MASISRDIGRFPMRVMALGLGIWLLTGPGEIARGGDGKGGKFPLHGRRHLGRGTLGYGPPGLHPGYPGFGLKYHLGYGYGGFGLGVGANGGYPGYEGPGYPCPGDRNRFPGVGPLVDNPPVAYSGDGHARGFYEAGFGPYNGAPPNPQRFAPYATIAPSGARATP